MFPMELVKNILYFRFIMVQMVSVVSGNKVNIIRERLGDKAEIMKFDPWSKLLKYSMSRKFINNIYF